MPVFKMACRLRFEGPSPEELINRTETQLEVDIVAAILEGALHLLLTDDSTEGSMARKENEVEKARKAKEADAKFPQHLTCLDNRMLSETEQRDWWKAAREAGKEQFVSVAPDALSQKPVIVCTIAYRRVEYKNTFGFHPNPFMAICFTAWTWHSGVQAQIRNRPCAPRRRPLLSGTQSSSVNSCSVGLTLYPNQVELESRQKLFN